MRLKDKVALITGGGSGIGRETSLLFAREGAAVVVADVVDDAGRHTVDQITSQEGGGRASYVHADVASAKDSEAMIAHAEREFGRFARGVRVTGAFDVHRARATLREGELTIVLPKLDEDRRGRPHRIPIGQAVSEP